MKRFALALGAAVLTVGVLPGLASAQEIQVGNTTTPLAAPTCPQEATVAATETDCAIVLDHTTAYQTASDGTANPDAITAPGLIDSFTLAISGLYIQGATLSSEVSTLNTNWGSPPSAQLTVLRQIPGVDGPRYAVAAQSPVMPLLPYITGQTTGTITEFPLIVPLPVVKGELLAITVPTWAPILTFGLSATNFAYSQSHTQILTGSGASQKTNCDSNSNVSLAQSALGDQANYTCSFAGTRLEYTALEITEPAAAPPVKTTPTKTTTTTTTTPTTTTPTTTTKTTTTKTTTTTTPTTTPTTTASAKHRHKKTETRRKAKQALPKVAPRAALTRY